MRLGPRGVVALDFGAILAFASAVGAPVDLVAELLPEIESLIVSRFHAED